jgi:hypothetical protein
MLLRPAYPISRGYLCHVCGPFGALEPTRLRLPPVDESKEILTSDMRLLYLIFELES